MLELQRCTALIKISFKRQKGINSVFKRSMIFSDFSPSNIVKSSARRFKVLDHFLPTRP